MPIEETPDDVQQDILARHKRGESQRSISRDTGVSRTAVQNTLKRAARRGDLGPIEALPGFEIARTAQRLDKTGAVIGQSIEQRPERGGSFNIPPSHDVKGVSALVDSTGRVVQQWYKTGARQLSPEEVAAHITGALEAYRGYAKLPPCPDDCAGDLLNVYPVADLHFGMYAWADEAGEDYDTEIAARLFRDTFGALIQKSPKAKSAVLLGLGDLFHADNMDNQTRRSGHALDVDTRYPRVLKAGTLLMRMAVEMLAAKHETVEVRILPGNHDEHSAHSVATSLSILYDGHSRVTVDSDPSLFWFARFGRNMLGAHHGHEANPKEAAGIMASHRPYDWGATEWRRWYSGHLHHAQKGGEGSGAIWEIMQTIAPKDAWGAGKGFYAGRSLVCDTYHKDQGPQSRVQVNVPGAAQYARKIA